MLNASETIYRVEYTYLGNPNESVMFLVSPEAAIAEVRDRRRRGQVVALWAQRLNLDLCLVDKNEAI